MTPLILPAAEPDASHARASLWDRIAIATLGACGFALSFDALRQMAEAIHVRDPLPYVFPLVIDGFIAYGIRALLVLHSAPLRARIYVWVLVGTATAVSIWANALHAVRLNQVGAGLGHADGVSLGDYAVGVLSTVAPIALAGAVHLYILISRDTDATAPGGSPALSTSDSDEGPCQERDFPGLWQPTTLDYSGERDTNTSPAAEVPVRDTDVPRIPRPRGTVPDEVLLELARTAPRPAGRPSRKQVGAVIRDHGLGVSSQKLAELMTVLRSED